MEELEELKRRMEQDRPADWDSLPDLSLYMDQIISYMPRQLIHFNESGQLTSAMVNNYIKDGLVPRSTGKRYSREHLGYLTAVSALKKILSVRDVGILLKAGVERESDSRTLYNYFCGALDEALSSTAEKIDVNAEEKDLPSLALNLALESYACQLACARILDIIQPEEPRRKNKKE